MGEPTKGPWAVNMYAENASGFVQHRIESADEHGIVNDGYMIAEVDGPDAQANAHLIAAAPDMFEALSGMIGLIELLASREDGVTQDYMQDVLLNQHRVLAAHAAILKASPGEKHD